MVLIESKDRLRVLHIVTVPFTGVFMVSPIARRQTERDYSVEFACGTGEYLDKLKQFGFPVMVVSLSRNLLSYSHVLAVYQLWRLMSRRQYHVVHTHTPIASFLGRIAAVLAQVPIVIYHMRASWWDLPDANSLARLGFTIVEWTIAHLVRTDHVFVLNSSDALHLIKQRLVSPDRVTCLHSGASGVDTERFDPNRITDEQRKCLKTELGIGNSDFVIGFIGRMVREKGIVELAVAFRDVIRCVPTAKLLFVGGVLSSEHDKTAIEDIRVIISDDSDLADKIIFTSFRDDVPDLLAIMDVLVLPSHREAFGMVMAEAAAMACPVIATNTPGAREAVIPGKNGLIVPIGNVEALKNAILQLADDPHLRRRMGEAGRRIALERFDELVVFQKIDEVYVRLLREKGVPVPSK
jgi:glycosyltransferase involved in cell wall biosynthesis